MIVDSNKKQSQLQYIDSQITTGNNEKFKVINTEAGLGKSLQAEKSMINAWFNYGIKSLYVTRFKDTKECESWFTSHGRINNNTNTSIALAIDNETYKKIKYKNTIKDYPIVIITHEKYKILAQDTKQRNIFTDGRDNLIIDEEPNMIESYIYNLKRISWYENILPRGLKSKYNEIIKELESYLQVSKTKSFFNTKNGYTKMLNEFRIMLNTNITSEYAKQYNKPQFENPSYIQMTKSLFLEEVDILKELYSHTAVVDKDTAYTFNSKIKYWTLKNNILLDANGGFNYLYKLSDQFELATQSKIVDHGNWTLNVCNANSTKSSKSSFTNYYKEIDSYIKGNIKPNDKILVIGSMEDEKNLQQLKTENITTEHFGNLIGRNDWRDYNVAYLIHNPNTPYYVYVLKYLYYSNKRLDNRSNWDLINSNHIMQFKNEELDKVRVSYLTGEIYQAVKRIDRDLTQNSRIYLINNDDSVINLLSKQFKNIKNNNFNLNIEVTKQSKTETETLTNPQKFIIYLSKFEKGNKQLKSTCMKDMGISNRTYFYNKILKHEQVLLYMKNNNFNADGHYITKN